MTAKAKYELHARLRTDMGKGASRRLRRTEDQIPAILYGGKEHPTTISFDQKKMMHTLENEGIYSRLLTLHLEGEKQNVVLKDIQRHPFKKAIVHMDLLRVKPNDVIHMRIPIHFKGGENAPGVKLGGIINHRMNDIEVRCQAKNLPEFFEIDLSHMEMDQSLHLSDVKYPEGVESVSLSYGPEHDHPVVSVHLPRIQAEELETPVAAEGEAATAAAGTEAGKEAKESKDTAKKDAGKDAKDKGKGGK